MIKGVRFASVLALGIAVFSFSDGRLVLAQDPFGGDTPGFPDQAKAPDTTVSAGESPADLTNPLIQGIRRRATEGTVGLGDAIRKSVQISRWDLAGDLLQQLVTRDLSRDDLASIAKQIPDATLFRMRVSPLLSAERREVVRRLQEASFNEATDPQRLDAEVLKLASSNPVVLRAAELELLRGGKSSIEALLAAIIATPPENVDANGFHQRIQSTLKRFEQPAVAAMVRLALDLALASPGNVDHQRLTTMALFELSPQEGLRHGLTVFYSERLDPTLRQSIGEFIQARYSRVPSRKAIIKYLSDDLQHTLAAWRDVSYGGEPSTQAWLTGDEKRPVLATELTHRDALSTHAALIAQRLRLLGIESNEIQTMALAAELGAAYSESSGFGLEEGSYASLEKRLGISDKSFVDQLEQALYASLELKLSESSIVALRLLGQSGDPELLAAQGLQPRPIVTALDHPSAVVRFEAVDAISLLHKKTGEPFTGESIYKRRLNELAVLTDHPIAMLVEPRDHIAATLEDWLRRIGFEVLRAYTGHEAVTITHRHSTIDFAVVSSHPPDVGPIEMVDRLRKLPQAALAPMLIVGPSPNERGLGIQNPNPIIPPALWVPNIATSEEMVRAHKDITGSERSLAVDTFAFVVEPRESEARKIIPWIEAMGYEVTWAPLLPDILGAIESASHVDLVVMTSQSREFRPPEFIARLRKTPTIAGTPVIIVGPEPEQPMREIEITESWDAPTRWLSTIDSPIALSGQRDRLEEQSKNVPLETLDRQRLRERAKDVLKVKVP